MIAYSQSHSEWVRQSAEQQVREYYQSKLNTKKSELRDAQNELVRLSNLPESEFHNNFDVKEQCVSLGVRIEALKAEIKMIEEEYNNKLGELRRIQQAAKSGQAQKTGQQKNAVRRKQSQSRQAAASRRDAEQKNRHAKFNLAKIKRLICGIPHLVMKNRVAVSYGRLLLRRMGKWPPRRMAAICRKL